MPTPNPATVAAVNALQEGKSFRRFEFPLTGDPELDAISGIEELLRAIPITDHRSVVRLIEFIARRHREAQNEADEKLADWKRSFGHLSSAAGTTPALPSPPGSGLTEWAPPGGWTSGGSGMARS